MEKKHSRQHEWNKRNNKRILARIEIKLYEGDDDDLFVFIEPKIKERKADPYIKDLIRAKIARKTTD